MKAIKTNRLLTHDGYQKAFVIYDQKIQAITQDAPKNFMGHAIDIGDLVLMPALIDSHVHINEPGRTDWEGFETATHAAAAGGIATLVDMPLNCSPVTTSANALNVKLGELEDKLWVDCAFWGGVTCDNQNDLSELLSSGVSGVKSFLIDSGLDEFQPVSLSDLDWAMPMLSKFNLPYLFHAELDQGEARDVEIKDYPSFLASRPDSFEVNAIEKVIQKAKEHDCRIHIVHLSSAKALDAIKKAKQEGVKISVESCPHYLTLSSENILKQKNSSTLFKCCPPIRDQENSRLLWQALVDGTIDFIVSDHSPCTPALKKIKENDLSSAWGGISSLQYNLPIVWTKMKELNLPAEKLLLWLCEGPAKLAGLDSRKGKVEVGMDADFAIWDPECSFVLDGKDIHYKHKVSPYLNETLFGKVQSCVLRGEEIFNLGKFFGPKGRAILKELD